MNIYKKTIIIFTTLMSIPAIFVTAAVLASREDTTWFILSIGIILLWALV